LDVAGAAFDVTECPQLCLADAGGIAGFKPTDCLFEGGTLIGGIPNGDAVVPEGYEVLYVLTQGDELVIVDAAATPFFTVTAIGMYTIHTLVYDPLTLDLSIVEFGVTTGGDVNALLIQGGGEICGSLDVAGTSILIDNPDAGTLTAVEATVCLVEGSATITATPNGDAYVPMGYETLYVLTQGAELVIIDAGAAPAFEVTSAGNYTIHTLVYDPATLDLSGIEFGVTTGADVYAMLIAGGGSYCAALDVTGAPVEVSDCDGGDGLVVTDVYPVPTSDVLNIELRGESSRVEIGVLDMRGTWVSPARTLAKGEQRIQLDVTSLSPGQYILRLVSDERITMHRFIVVQ
jgi:hypothetical protein